MAIDGIYSHWITENILAMARPNTAAMKKYNLITQFKVRRQLLLSEYCFNKNATFKNLLPSRLPIKYNLQL